MKKLAIAVIAVALIGTYHSSRAEDKPGDAPAAAGAATPAPVIAPGDKAALEANMGKQASVEGMVTDAEWSPTGRVFLIKFEGADATQFQGALLSQNREAVEKAFGPDLTAALEGAKIRLSGKLQMYREHPEILIEKPDQIAVLQKPTVAPGDKPKAKPAAAARRAEEAQPRLFGVYANLQVTADQRAKIAAIQKEAYEKEKAIEKQIREEQDAKIATLLSDEQKQQLERLKKEADKRYQNYQQQQGDKD
jgi:hypothetical protein